MENYQDIQVIIDPEVAGMDFDARYPYFRMRGKPVTEEQAFDIIRRTDNFFCVYMDRKYRPEGLISGIMLGNAWFGTNGGDTYGWVRPDGIVGLNRNTWKYPTEEGVLYEVLPLKETFPYLDFMIAVTDWDECPDYVRALRRCDFDDALSREDYPDFPEHIVYGIWVHDDKVELMAPERAREKYLEYNRLYGGADEAIFTWSYYEDRSIHPADFEYLCRCIRSHGLDPDEVLAEYVWTSGGLTLKRFLPEGQGGAAAVPSENGSA